jgi:protein TonB
MVSVLDRLLPGRQRERISGRALAFTIVVLIHMLLAGVLLIITPPKPKPKNDNTPNVFLLLPDPTPQRERKPAPKAQPPASKALTTTPVPPPQKPQPPAKPVVFGDLAYSAFDIAKMTSAAPASTTDAGVGASSDSAAGVGTGPGGVTLYKAEWVREPTQAELSFYMPKGMPDNSWGMIACRTAARFLVEDCVALEDSPRGSGISRALTNAAWQFKVRPPRIDGKAEVGAWVRIRIDFSSKNTGDADRRTP